MLESYIDKVISDTEPKIESQSTKKYANKNYESDSHTFDEQNSNEGKGAFYSKVKNQIDTLFDKNEADEILENIIPESKFCKVSHDGEFYVFGVIYENGKEKCICYGLPAEYSAVPPKELEGFCQWLPIDSENYQGKGYWMTYQDAISGENISVEII